MLYHYTSLQAMQGILKDAATKGTMCFWATRYDCFADKKEYKLGVETIKELLPEIEKVVLPDRQIATLLDWKNIDGNPNLLNPYVISLSARYDNEYMWSEYASADSEGVVLGIDDSVLVPNLDLNIVLTNPCIYLGHISKDELKIQVSKVCSFAEQIFLHPTEKNKILSDMILSVPQGLAIMKTMLLMAFEATVIKENDYDKEEETRVIILSQLPLIADFVKANRSVIHDVLHLDSNCLAQAMQEEKVRQRDGKNVYYREYTLPIETLQSIYTRPEHKEKVEKALAQMALKGIPVVQR